MGTDLSRKGTDPGEKLCSRAKTGIRGCGEVPLNEQSQIGAAPISLKYS